MERPYGERRYTFIPSDRSYVFALVNGLFGAPLLFVGVERADPVALLVGVAFALAAVVNLLHRLSIREHRLVLYQRALVDRRGATPRVLRLAEVRRVERTAASVRLGAIPLYTEHTIVVTLAGGRAWRVGPVFRSMDRLGEVLAAVAAFNRASRSASPHGRSA